MNKIIFTLILGFAGFLNLQAQTPAPLKAIRQEAMKFLTTYGYSPSVEATTQRISFKKEGTEYWLAIEEENPFCVEFHRSDISIPDADAEQAIKSCNYATNHVMGAKAYWKNNKVVLSARYYVRNTAEFNKMFYKYLNQIDLLNAAFKKSYNDK